jgi:energy-converting hydrogenase B subunit F
MNSEIMPLMVVLPLAAAVLLNLIHGRDRMLRYFILAAGLAFLSLPLLTPYGLHAFGGHTRESHPGESAVGIIHSYQAHHRIIISTLLLITYLVVASYVGVFRRLSGPYLGFMMLGVAACIAVLLADDLFNLYVFLEVALISQTAMAIANRTERAYRSSLKYLIVANVSGNCLLLGIAMLFSITGSLNISDMQATLSGHGTALLHNPLFLVAAALTVFAWSNAGGLFPFHNIKSELYASARPHASGLMQTVTKFIIVAVGIASLRLFAWVGVVRPIMLYMSLGAMVLGVIMALKQDDYQRMLSYHAISQAGYVASGLSIGSPMAIVGGVFHAVNHVLYKTALFLGCECIQHRSKTTDFKSLGGMMQSMPFIGLLVLGAKFAISGIPPFNGFQSKLMLMTAALNAGLPEVTLIMLLVSLLTFVSMMKAFYCVFLRPRGSVGGGGEQTPPAYVIALVVLVGLCVLLGLFPQVATSYIEPIAYQIGHNWR